MRKGIWPLMLAALLGAAAGAAGLGGAGAQGALSLFSPFSAIARGLRALSLSGDIGNAIAWAIYAALSLLPLAGLLPRGRKRDWADWLFLAAAAYGFFYWYAMANPSLFLSGTPMSGADAETVYRGMLTILLFAMLIGAAALRLTGEGDAKALIPRLRVALYICALGLSALGAFGAASSIRACVGLGAAEIGWQAFGSLCSLAVLISLIMTLLSAAELLAGMGRGWFADENEALAETLSKRARLLLAITVGSEILRCTAAVLLIGKVSDANASFDLPITEFVLACALLLLARFVRDGARLRRESETFI